MSALDLLMRQVNRRRAKTFRQTKLLSRGFIKDAIAEKMYQMHLIPDNIEILDMDIQALTKEGVHISFKMKEV